MEVDKQNSAEFDSEKIANLKNDFIQNCQDSLVYKSLALPTLVHLSRNSLKRFLTKTAQNEENVENAKDSILGKWALIAKRAKKFYDSEIYSLFPRLLQ